MSAVRTPKALALPEYMLSDKLGASLTPFHRGVSWAAIVHANPDCWFFWTDVSLTIKIDFWSIHCLKRRLVFCSLWIGPKRGHCHLSRVVWNWATKEPWLIWALELLGGVGRRGTGRLTIRWYLSYGVTGGPLVGIIREYVFFVVAHRLGWQLVGLTWVHFDSAGGQYGRFSISRTLLFGMFVSTHRGGSVSMYHYSSLCIVRILFLSRISSLVVMACGLLDIREGKCLSRTIQWGWARHWCWTLGVAALFWYDLLFLIALLPVGTSCIHWVVLIVHCAIQHRWVFP